APVDARAHQADPPADVQPLPEPAGARRARVETQALRGVVCSERRDGIVERGDRRRDLYERAAVGPPELERPLGPARDGVALLVDGAMMPATEHHQVPERGRAALGPVAHVLSLPDAPVAAREAAAPVAMVQGAPERGRNRARPGADL